MEDNFSSLIGSAITDHSVPDCSWYFLGHDDQNSSESSLHQINEYECFNNYSSNHDSQFSTFTCSSKELYTSSSSRLSVDEAENDPFSLRCRIPVPSLGPMSRYHMWLETSFMCRRNERERQRVRNVNDGFSRLRNHLPRTANMRRRQSKVETLQHAIKYIKHLQDLLKEKQENGEECQ